MSRHPAPEHSGPPTKLILGGVTEHGHRAAMELAKVWGAEGARVIWFDGWFSDSPAETGRPDLIVIGHGERERRRASIRLEEWLTRGVVERGGRLRSTLATLARRWNTATRGYLGWRMIREDVRRTADEVSPEEIAYCDEHAATAAWHAARIWPNAHVRRA